MTPSAATPTVKKNGSPLALAPLDSVAPDPAPALLPVWPKLGAEEGVGAGALYPEPPVGYDMWSSPIESFMVYTAGCPH
ncbi:hypothetical protein NWFMUON74_63640 [Nocardia wallacei]|uniref:Uncharacterized protein n=1 Tax=Nocardia wallacei TaxID=480035 RepID=A0A7G1KU25_9NOCA|nr:hypothetical protein NWFMUON74_63640 [Nocardia wallacei]